MINSENENEIINHVRALTWSGRLKENGNKIRRKVKSLFRYFSQTEPDKLGEVFTTLSDDETNDLSISDELGTQVLDRYLETNRIDLEEEFGLNQNQLYLAMIIGIRAEKNARKIDMTPLCSWTLLDIDTCDRAKSFLMDYAKQSCFADVFVKDTKVATPIQACLLLTIIYAEIEGWPLAINRPPPVSETNIPFRLPAIVTNNTMRQFNSSEAAIIWTQEKRRDDSENLPEIFRSRQIAFQELQHQRNTRMEEFSQKIIRPERSSTVEVVNNEETADDFMELFSIKQFESTIARWTSDDEGTFEDAVVVRRIDQTSYEVRFADEIQQIVSDTDIAVPSLPMYSDQMRAIALPGLRVAAYVRNAWYSGTVAAQPNSLHKNRYLVFFDAGFEEYVDAPYDPNSAEAKECSDMTESNQRRQKQMLLPLARQSLVDQQSVQYDLHGNQIIVNHQQVYKLLRNHLPCRKFLKQYFAAYPEWRLCRMKVNLDKPCQIIHVLDNYDQPQASRVVQVDAHMCVLRFQHPLDGGSNCSVYPCEEHLHKDEKMFRGHPRIINAVELSKQHVERTENSTKQIALNEETLKSKKILQNLFEVVNRKEADPLEKLALHFKCTPECLQGQDRNPADPEFYKCSPLHIPMMCGWRRKYGQAGVKRAPSTYVRYEAPCGSWIVNIRNLGLYLKATNSQLTIDLFCFDVNIRPSKYVEPPFTTTVLNDYAMGKEGIPIPVVNTFVDDYMNAQHLPPKIDYSSKSSPFNQNVDMSTVQNNFCTGCSCEDDCSDADKCECQQLTKKSWERSPAGLRMLEYGYKNRRLAIKTISGIYECNKNCQCKRSKCYNRVVQNPMKFPLQLFKTVLSGWGVRTLVDIPRGAFIVNYVGEILNDSIAETLPGRDDTYFAEIDLIDVMEREKQAVFRENENLDLGFESEGAEDENKKKNPHEDDEESFSEDSTDSDYEPVARKQKKKPTKRKRKDGKKSQKKNNKKAKKEKKAKETKEVNIDQLTERFDLTEFFGDNYLYVIDAKKKGNIGRFLNHSCDPNVEVQHVFVDTHDLRLPWSAFFAKKNIMAGEELCWNYCYPEPSPTRPLNQQLQCSCGSQNCRGRLL